MITQCFQHAKRYVSPPPQARAAVRVFSPSGSVFNASVLVDTGAVYTQFPQVVAQQLGLSIAAMPLYTVMLANGATAQWPLDQNGDLEIEGQRLTAPTPILYAPSGNSLAVIGLETLRLALELGFDQTQWLWSP